jgi:hypothetical protein
VSAPPACLRVGQRAQVPAHNLHEQQFGDAGQHVLAARLPLSRFPRRREEQRRDPAAAGLRRGDVEQVRQCLQQRIERTVGSNQFILFDTRGLRGTEESAFVTRDQARLIPAGARQSVDRDVEWALEKKLVATISSHIVPLATASPEPIREFEDEAKTGRSACH